MFPEDEGLPEDELTRALDAAMKTVQRAESRAEGLTIAGNVVLILALVVFGTMVWVIATDKGGLTQALAVQVALSTLLTGWIFRTVLVGLGSLVEVGAQRLRFELLDRFVDE